jgi:GH25 family lysozyme M1 (1,4-beta-N-acetylmuramidase)/rubredoxin
MKKHTSLFSILLLLCVVGFIICGIMMDWFTTEDTVIKPTCTEQGYTLHRGWFGRESHKDPTAPLGHRYRDETDAPTCLESGVAHYVCADCGHTYDGDPIPPTGHSYTATVVAPTCTSGGYTNHICTVCGDSYRDAEVEPIGHVFLSTVTPATCVQGGYTTHTCTTCEYTYRDAEVDPLGHLDTVEVIAPTCLAPGYTLTVCGRCAAANVVDPKEALGHNYLPYVTHPTCTTAGYTTHLCANCADSYTTDYIDARGHNYVTETMTATATHAGGKVHTCSRCGDKNMTEVYTFAEVFDGRQGDGKGILAEGVDLSHHNKDVDFAALKAAGIDFVILRVGTSRTPDTMFESYYAQAREAGLDIGAYILTYAKTVADAKRDAAWMAQVLQGKSFEYPIFFDIEDASLENEYVSPTVLTDLTLAFCEEMINAGYYPGVYTNKTWMSNHLEMERIRDKYDIRLASWVVTGENISDYSDDFAMWQYTDKGNLAGVATAVDRNGVYRDFPSFIKKYGYNGLG